jgi:hypothetical protein
MPSEALIKTELSTIHVETATWNPLITDP